MPKQYLYLIHIENSIYKIGVSNNPKRRIKELKGLSVVAISKNKIMYMEGLHEYHIKALLCSYKVKNKQEYFNLPQRIVEYIKIIISNI